MARALAAAITAADVACVLLRVVPGLDDDTLRAAADRLRPLAQERDVAFFLEDRAGLVTALRADGVHLSRVGDYAEARRQLGPDVAIGVACDSRDDAMAVAERDADYVAFGGFDDATPTAATLDLTAWWGELMTTPCVACGCAGPDDAGRLAAAGVDFVAVGSAGWSAEAGLTAWVGDVARAVLDRGE